MYTSISALPRRTTAALVVLAMAFTMLATPAFQPEAKSHTSTYCGHGSSGILIITSFWYTLSNFPVHEHAYRHYLGTGEYLHFASRAC